MRRSTLILTLCLAMASLGATAQDWTDADTLTTEPADSTECIVPTRSAVNIMDLSYNDLHRYTGDLTTHKVPFIEIGFGRMAINDNRVYDPSALTLLNLRFGYQLNGLSSLRFGLSGGPGMTRRPHSETSLKSVNGRVAIGADYLYSISTFLMGYRPERTLDVSGFVGVGVGYSRLFKSDKDEWEKQFERSKMTAFARGGFQLKFFAGPRAAIAFEPYVYASTKGIDLVREENDYYSYRIGFGLDVTFVQYLGDRLTTERNAGTFKENYSRQQRYFLEDIPAAHRHLPMIVGLQTGMAGISGHGRTIGESLGLAQSAYVGWWMSSSIGIRGEIASDNLDWGGSAGKGLTAMTAHRRGAVSLMVNPFGFNRSYDWQHPAGVSLLLGYEGGYLFRENNAKTGYATFGFQLGANLWTRITDNLRLTFEPQYAAITHKGNDNTPTTDDVLRLKLGMEMMLGDGYKADANYDALLPSGYFVGLGGGWNYTPRFKKESGHNTGLLKNGLLFAGYELNDLSSIKVTGEYLTDVFWEKGVKDRQNRIIVSADYRLNAINRIWGINPQRHWNLFANIGPALAFGDDNLKFGANAAVELTYRLSRHYSFFASHNIYWMPAGLYDTDQTTGTHLSNTFNLGVMYHF